MYITIKYTAAHEVHKHDETYQVAANIQNCKHVLRDVTSLKFTFRNQYDAVSIATGMRILVSFKHWCTDSS